MTCILLSIVVAVYFVHTPTSRNVEAKSNPIKTRVIGFRFQDAAVTIEHNGLENGATDRPDVIVGVTREGQDLYTRNLNWDIDCVANPYQFCHTTFWVDGGADGFRLEKNGVSIAFDILNPFARQLMVGTWLGDRWEGHFGNVPYYSPDFVADLNIPVGSSVTRRLGVVEAASAVIPHTDYLVTTSPVTGMNIGYLYCPSCEMSTSFGYNMKFWDVTFTNNSLTGNAPTDIKVVNHSTPSAVINLFPPATIQITGGSQSSIERK